MMGFVFVAWILVVIVGLLGWGVRSHFVGKRESAALAESIASTSKPMGRYCTRFEKNLLRSLPAARAAQKWRELGQPIVSASLMRRIGRGFQLQQRGAA